jgi:cell division protein FtsX
MFGLSSSILKWAIGIAVALFICAAGYFAVHTFTSTVKQNGQLQATNVTLKADAAKATSATEVAVKKLDQLDTITQEKQASEQAIHKDNAAFKRQREALAASSPVVQAWASEPVPASVVLSLCERTAVRSPDCHRDQDGANPQVPDSANASSGVQAGH